jgi:hypothetical protein
LAGVSAAGRHEKIREVNPIDVSELPLRDIHLPDPVSWWPPAPGWWLLAAALVAALGWALWQRYRTRRLRVALAAIRRISAELEAGAEPVDCLQQLSVVLRRFVMSTAAGADARTVPGLVGPRWLEYLDAHGGGTRFREGPGRLLLDGPYVPAETLRREDAAEVSRLRAGGIETQRAPGRAPPRWTRHRGYAAEH